MRKYRTFVRGTAEGIRAMLDKEGDRTDWAAAMAMSQDEVERLADEEDGPLPEGWEATVTFGVPEPKKDVHIRLDPSIIRWFKAQGPGYQTRINAVLSAFVRAKTQGAGK